jgi:hypothetical protein
MEVKHSFIYLFFSVIFSVIFPHFPSLKQMLLFSSHSMLIFPKGSQLTTTNLPTTTVSIHIQPSSLFPNRGGRRPSIVV